MDRDGTGVTLAATNGLDPEQVGAARLPLGVGITGIVAQTRKPATSVNVHRDARFHYIRGVDKPQYTSMCSVPLIWNDQVIGVLNVQTERRREFTRRGCLVPRDAGGAAGRDRRAQPTSTRGRSTGREPARDR